MPAGSAMTRINMPAIKTLRRGISGHYTGGPTVGGAGCEVFFKCECRRGRAGQHPPVGPNFSRPPPPAPTPTHPLFPPPEPGLFLFISCVSCTSLAVPRGARPVLITPTVEG